MLYSEEMRKRLREGVKNKEIGVRDRAGLLGDARALIKVLAVVVGFAVGINVSFDPFFLLTSLPERRIRYCQLYQLIVFLQK